MQCEVSPVKCRVPLFGQQRGSMRDICCSVIRIHLVTCLRPSSTATLSKLQPFFAPSPHSPLTLPFSHSLVCPHNPSLHLFFCGLYLNSLGLADNPGVLPICSEMRELAVNDQKTARGNGRLNLNEPRWHKLK